MNGKGNKKSKKDRKFNKTKEWLYEEFVIKGRKRADVAKECGLTEHGLKNCLTKYGITQTKLVIREDILTDLVDQKYSVKELADYFKCGVSSIYRALRKYRLSIMAPKKENSTYDGSNDEEMIRAYTSGKPLKHIAEAHGITIATVKAHLLRNNITLRTMSEAQWLSMGREMPSELLDKNKILKLYEVDRLSKKDMGRKFECDPCVIDRVLKLHGIPVRDASASKMGMNIGAQHPNWQGGVTTLYARLREAFRIRQKKLVHERDGYKCVLCGSTENLHTHHIVPFNELYGNILKENPYLSEVDDSDELYKIALKDVRFNNLNNVITVCRECHIYKIHSVDNKEI